MEKQEKYEYSVVDKKIALSVAMDNSEKTSVCVEVLRPRQPNGVMLSAVSLPNHTFTGQA